MTPLSSQKDPERDESHTDSPNRGEPVFLVIGRLRRSHGIKGEIGMEVLTDFPERLKPGKQVFIGEDHRPLKINQIRAKGKLILLLFEGYDTCEQVNNLRNQLVYISGQAITPLPEGQYYHHQIIGLSVKDPAGNLLGKITEILSTGANDVYVVKQENGKEILLPAIGSVILEVNLEQGVLTTQPPEWL